ncbi:hypothetical protein FA15DRAFT_659392 [Coprinopsis marcescibilis]|uniref:Uncharacterized protein n=1 Tax=Coprinopsis marcescibilis TaxID=230819 RepID=A0A5C3KJF1_COPMA|nr:hypothetical protein FA15DRAFT_659392 [Coprinopsis marcescibilis]
MAPTSMIMHSELIWQEIFSKVNDIRTLTTLTYIRPFRNIAHHLLYQTISLALSGDGSRHDKIISLLHHTFMENPVLGEYVQAVEFLGLDDVEQSARSMWIHMREFCIGGYLGKDMMCILQGDPLLQHPNSEAEDNEDIALAWPNYHDGTDHILNQWQTPGILQCTPNMPAIIFGQDVSFSQIYWTQLSHSMHVVLVKAFQHKHLEHISGQPEFHVSSCRSCMVLSEALRMEPWKESITHLTIYPMFLSQMPRDTIWTPSVLDLESLGQLETLQLHFCDKQSASKSPFYSDLTPTEAWWMWAIQALNSALRQQGTSVPTLHNISLTVGCLWQG